MIPRVAWEMCITDPLPGKEVAEAAEAAEAAVPAPVLVPVQAAVVRAVPRRNFTEQK